MHKHLTTIFVSGLLIFSLSANAAINLQFFITGVAGPEQKNILERLKIHQEPYNGKLTVRDVKRSYHESHDQIKEAIAPFGYLKPTIQSALLHRGDNWQAHYKITLGPRLKITELTIKLLGEGKNDPAYQKLLAHVSLKEGDVFNAEKYIKTKQKFYDLATDHGYFKASMIKSVVKIDKQTYRCYITIIFNTGPRYRFGLVTFTPTPFAEKFLQRFVPFKPGQYYHDDEVQKLRHNLESASYFEGVTIKQKPNKANKRLEVPIDVKIVPRKPKRYSLGAGYGTDTGPRVLLGIDWRRLTPTGDQFNTEAKLSYIQQTLNANYIIPGSNPATDQYRIFATGQKYNDKDTGQFYTSGKVGVSYTTLIWGWQPILSLNMIVERYELIGFPTENAILLMPSLRLTRIHSDDVLRPTKGYSISLLGRGAYTKLLSSVDFYQLRADFKWLRSLTKYQRVFLHSTFGYTDIHNINDLPLSLQFAAGGAQSIRGYPYRKLIYGRYITVLGVELQQRVFGNFYILGFT